MGFQFIRGTGTIPTVTDVSPATGTGATAITITGTGFTASVTVTVGGVAATSVVRVSSTSITCVTPVGDPVGPHEVRVLNSTGLHGLKYRSFEYLSDPTVTSITPNTGEDWDTTTTHTVGGTLFVTGCTVKVGGVAAPSVVFNSSTSLTITCPARVLGAATVATDVVVTNPDTQTGTLTNGYTYSRSPYSISPEIFVLGNTVALGALSVWANKGTGGGNLSATGTPTGVTGLNSHNAVNFAGTDHFNYASDLGLGDTGFSAFILCKINTLLLSTGIMKLNNPYVYSDALNALHVFNAGVADNSWGTDTAGYHLLEVHADPVAPGAVGFEVRIDGAVVVTAQTQSYTGSSAAPFVGGQTLSNALASLDVSMWVLKKGVVSAGNRAIVRGYSTSEFGVP